MSKGKKAATEIANGEANLAIEDSLFGSEVSVNLEFPSVVSEDEIDESGFQEIEEEDESNNDIDSEQEEEVEVRQPKGKKTLKKEVEEAETELEEEIQENDDDSNSNLKILASYLRDEGIVEFEDDEFRDEDDFINELVIKQIDKGIDSYKQELPKVIKDLIDNYEEGVPLSELLGMKVENENFLTIKTDDLSDNETKQKSVVREYYKRLGWKDEKISAKIEKLEARADLEDTSIELLPELQEIIQEEEANFKEHQKMAEQQKIQQFENYKKEFKADLEKRDEIFKGLKLTPKQKEQMFNGIFVADKDGKNELTKKLEKDKDYNLKLAYMTLVLDWDLSAIEKIANTKAAKGLRAALEGGKSKFGGNGLSANKSTGERVDFGVIKKAL